MPSMQSEIVIPEAPDDLDYATSVVPNLLCGLAHDLANRGQEEAVEFLVRMLAAVTGSMMALSGQEAACVMLARQLEAAEAWTAET